MKPTFGLVSMEGVKRYAPTLDTLGWYARSVEDLELLTRVFEISDAEEPNISAPLRVAVCRTPYWDLSSSETRDALAEAARRLLSAGVIVDELELDPEFSNLDKCRKTVMRAEGRVSFLELQNAAPGRITPGIRETMELSNTRKLCEALDDSARLRPVFDELARPFDAILVPSSTGEAPIGRTSTGNSIFNALWTILHVPCINLPGLVGPCGLPVGIQLVGPRYSDNKLLSVAKKIESVVKGL